MRKRRRNGSTPCATPRRWAGSASRSDCVGRLPVPGVERAVGLHHGQHRARQRRHVHAMSKPRLHRRRLGHQQSAARALRRRMASVLETRKGPGAADVARPFRRGVRRADPEVARARTASCRRCCAAWWDRRSAGARRPIYLPGGARRAGGCDWCRRARTCTSCPACAARIRSVRRT